MMRESLIDGSVMFLDYLAMMRRHGLQHPFALGPQDFLNEMNPEDVVMFPKVILNDAMEEFDELQKKLAEAGDEISGKQLKSAKVKIEQTLNGRSTGRTFQACQREFYEKLTMTKILLGKK
jgi:TRAP-type C4-dicarboxylate transport system substrate-binding protein